MTTSQPVTAEERTLGTHTPGPWVICGNERGGCSCGHIWSRTTDQHVATATLARNARADDLESQEVSIQSEDEQTANARLIAAAPELLEALQRIASPIPDMGSHRDFAHRVDIARAAVANATGAA